MTVSKTRIKNATGSMWVIQAILVMFLWAACFPLIMLGLQDAPHLHFAALRALLAGVVLLLVAVALRRPLPRDMKTWLQLGWIGLGATTLAFLGMFHASAFISPGLATVIASTQPILAAVLGYLLLSERLDKFSVVGLIFGFAGIVLIAWPETNNERTDYAMGLGYLLLAAMGITVSNVFIRRVAGSVDAIMAMAIHLLIGAVPLMLAAVVIEDTGDIVWTGEFIVSLLSLSLLGTAFACWLWCKVLETTELYRANVFTYLVPALGLLMGVLFYDERIGITMIFGVLLTLVSISLVNPKLMQFFRGNKNV